MSLISQQDRQMAIDALEFYIDNMKQINCNQAAINSHQALLMWIQLEYNKHEPHVGECNGSTGVS